MEKINEEQLIMDLLNSKYNNSCFHEFSENEIDFVVELINTNVKKNPLKLAYKPLIDEGWEYECPNCGYAVGENKYESRHTQKEKYCHDCGQKLDWEGIA